jgi:biotin carboxyl carrier protein
MVVTEGLAQDSRRFAIDWRKARNGKFFAGDERDPAAYFAFGEQVLAVADGVVVSTADGYPDNIPRTAAGFEPALPITMENLGGNSVVIRLAGGQFAQYFHLRAGSVAVKPGDRVKRGQVLARIGNSGDARNPHLHFQLTDGPKLFASEGLPYVIDRFRVKGPDGDWLTHRQEFPWGDATEIDFGDTR